ncbi:mucin-2 isoform X1 [Patella vulgata]|uniref:mucin-2 isoform X1 n=1 Tax=Patella vulgata TaxID=6465 RepID=UPI0021808D33|nr:mucin-2 isoform X1 [Patella vulgata]
MADLGGLSEEELDELDIDELLARVERKPLTFSRTKSLNQAPEFSKRLSGEDTVDEGGETVLTCVVLGFPRPQLFWYKDADQIHPDHPRMRVEEQEGGVYTLTIKNVSKGDEAGYKCKAVNIDGETASTFFLFVKQKPKKGGSRGKKRRRVSYPPMFATIVEKVEEEERAAKEARYAPPSPLSELYVGITLKSRHTWPKFLGEWAFAEDAVRSCSDETTESPPSSPDGEDPNVIGKIKVKVKVNEKVSKPVKSILKTGKFGEEPKNTNGNKSSASSSKTDPGKPPASPSSQNNNKNPATSTKKIETKSSTNRTESKKTTTTTTTTATTTKTTTRTTKLNGAIPTNTDNGKTVIKTTQPSTTVSEKTETKTTNSTIADSKILKTSESKTATNGSKLKSTTTTNSSTTTTTSKSNTRSLTAHRIEESKQSLTKPQGKTDGHQETKTASTVTNTVQTTQNNLPKNGKSEENNNTENKTLTDKVNLNNREPSPKEENGKKSVSSKTQSLQEKLIKQTTKTSNSSSKKISTGSLSLGVSKLSEKLTGSSPVREISLSPKVSPTKEVRKDENNGSTVQKSKIEPTTQAGTPNTTSSVTSKTMKSEKIESSLSQKITSTVSTVTTKPGQLNLTSNTSSGSTANTSTTASKDSKTSPASKINTINATGAPVQTNDSQNGYKADTPAAPTSTTALKDSKTKQTQQQTSSTKLTKQSQLQQTVQKTVVPDKTTTTSETKQTPVAPTSLKISPHGTNTKTSPTSNAIPNQKLPQPETTTSTTASSLKAASPVTAKASPTADVAPNQKLASPVTAKAPALLTASISNDSQKQVLSPAKSPSSPSSKLQSAPCATSAAVIESPVSPKIIPVHNMALPGKSEPESTGPKYKVSTVIKTTQQSPVPASVSGVTSPAASTSQVVTNTNVPRSASPRIERQQSVELTVVNKLVIDPRNTQPSGSPRRRDQSPVTIHRVRSRDVSPDTRVRPRERGKSPIMQLLPTDPSPKSPKKQELGTPSPVRYLPIISVKSRPSEKVIVQQPIPSSVIDLRGLGPAKTAVPPDDSVVLIKQAVSSQPVEFHKPFGSGKDPMQGMKQTFSEQKIQSHVDESHSHDPKVGIKRSISTEKLHMIETNTDVVTSDKSGPLGARSEIIGTDVTRTHLVTEQPAIPSQKVQPGQIPVSATQREILTKENVKQSVMEVGKPNFPKGTIMVDKPGSHAMISTNTIALDPSPSGRSRSNSESFASRYSSSGSNSPLGSPSSLVASRNSSRSPSPVRRSPLDYVQSQSIHHAEPPKQSRAKTSLSLNFNQVDTDRTPYTPFSPVNTTQSLLNLSGGNDWNRRQPPAPPKRSSSVERMMTQYSSCPTSPIGESPQDRRKTSMSFTPFFARSSVRGPVNINQYLDQGVRAQVDRSRRCQSVDRLPSTYYPSQGSSPAQQQMVYHAQPQYYNPPSLHRSVSVDVVPSLFETNQSSPSYREIPVEHQMSPDGAATLPRRRRRRNSVELMTKMFDSGIPLPRDDEQTAKDIDAALQYPDMGQKLLTQIQSLGNENHQFEEGSATLPRGKDSRGPRLKRRNSVEHIAKLFDQGIPVIPKDDDSIITPFSAQGGSTVQAPVNVVRPFKDNRNGNQTRNIPPDQQQQNVAHLQHPLSSRLSASQPHIASNNSNPVKLKPRSLRSIQTSVTNPPGQQAGRSRAAACSLNLRNIPAKSASPEPQSVSQKPVLRRSMSEIRRPSSGKNQQQASRSNNGEEDEKSYKRLSVGEAARLFDQITVKEPVAPRRSGGLNIAGKAQKFLAKFK